MGKKKLLLTICIFFIFLLSIPLFPQNYSTTYKITSVPINQIEYYPLYKVLNILKLKRYFDPYTGKIIIKDKNRYITFFIEEKKVYCEMQTYLLQYPPIRYNGVVYVTKEILNLISQWKKNEFIFNYINDTFKINKKQEIVYKNNIPPTQTHEKTSSLPEKNNNKNKKIPSINLSEKFKEKNISKDNRIKVIIIDPGHGGKDPGAIGTKGVREKDVVLKTSLYLKNFLSKKLKDVKIILTRDKDIFLPLEKRAKIANKYINKNTQGLFISVHANASLNKKTRGTETFVLSPVASDDEARAVAAMENGIIDIKTKKTDPITKILTGMLSYEYIRESIQLAKFIQKEYNIKLKARNTKGDGVKKALFYVLEGTLMPGVLTEIGFLTNPQEEKLLRKSWYQKKIAQCIGEGIIKFLNWYEMNNGFIQ